MPTSRPAISATTAIRTTAPQQRLLAALPSLNLASPAAATVQLRTMRATPAEFASAFRRLAKERGQ